MYRRYQCMNLLLLLASDFVAADKVVIKDRRADHLRSIKNIQVGDRISAGLLGGMVGEAVVSQSNDYRTELTISLTVPPPEALPVHLLLALPRPKMLRRILQTISAMGVKKLTLMNSLKVEKSYWQTPWLSEASIRENCILGLEQAKDTLLPEVRLEKRFKPFVEDRLPDLINGTHALLAHPETGIKCPGGVIQPVTLAIGPEGGFVDYEVEKLSQAGFACCHLGPRILRVENAIAVLLGRLNWC